MRQAASGLSADRDGPDTQFGGLHPQDLRRLLGQVGQEEGRADEGGGTEVLLHSKQTLRPGLCPDGKVDHSHVPGDLGDRDAADEALAHPEAVQHQVAGPEAVGVQGPRAHLAPQRDVGLGQADVGGAAGGAGGGLDLDDVRHVRRSVLTQRRLRREAVAQILLLGEREIAQ